MGDPYIWQTPVICRGLNNTLPDYMIEDDELASEDNIIPDYSGRGWLIKRTGITRVSDNKTAQTYSVYQGRNANYFHNGTVICNFAGTSLLTGMAAAVDYWSSFATYDIFVNGTDAQKTSNGSSFTALSGIPAGAKYIAAVNNFLYCAGHDKGKLRWSDAGTAETWNALNELIITQDENDDIRALAVPTNALLVLCTKSFYMVTGFSNLAQEVSYHSKTDGCLGSKSVSVTPYGVFWWGPAGMTWLKNDYSIDYPMYRKIRNFLANLDRAQDANVFSVWDPINQNVSFWCFRGGGSSQTTVNYRVESYTLYDAFFLHTGTGVEMAAAGIATISGVTDVYVGGYASSTYLFKQTGSTDDGAAISSHFVTKAEGSEGVERKSSAVILSTNLTSQEIINYRWGVDNNFFGKTNPVLTSVALTTTTGFYETYLAINQAHRRIQHRVDDVATSRTKYSRLTHVGEIVRVL